MRGFIEWLRSKVDILPDILKERFIAYRNESQDSRRHARLASDVAMLRIGYDFFVDYGIYLKVIDVDSAVQMKAEAGRIFMDLADEQSMRVLAEKPSVKFLAALRELLSTKQCVVQGLPLQYEHPAKQQGFIGYEDEAYYYLYAGMTYKYIFEFYSQQGSMFPVTEKTLWKHLDMDGYILTDERNGRIYRTKQKKIGGTNGAYIWLRKAAVYD